MDIHADFDSFPAFGRRHVEREDIYDAGARLVNLNPPIWTVGYGAFCFAGAAERVPALRARHAADHYWIPGLDGGRATLRAAWAVVGTGMLIVSSPLLATFALGQMYPVLALGLVAAWVADRRGMAFWPPGCAGAGARFEAFARASGAVAAVPAAVGDVGATIISGAAATLAGSLVLGPQATSEVRGGHSRGKLEAFWDNASLPSAALRLFTENEFTRPLATVALDAAGGLRGGDRAGDSSPLTGSGTVRRAVCGPWSRPRSSLRPSPGTITWCCLGPGILLLAGPAEVSVAGACCYWPCNLYPPSGRTSGVEQGYDSGDAGAYTLPVHPGGPLAGFSNILGKGAERNAPRECNCHERSA